MALIHVHFYTFDPTLYFSFVVKIALHESVMYDRVLSPEYQNEFGPFATSWENNCGVLDDRLRWDYWQGFWFKEEHDALLFRLMAGP